ncbi:hypothetical protein ACFVVU_30760 [Kitasatospora sp. NPDC057965]|uniref:hypothetical protein n=1 Tax=Kitasatospora sp. NPDC057965 TaxID=3346291 RepID=UPI0036DA6F0A
MDDHLTAVPTSHTQQALELLSPPGTARVFFDARYHELPADSRPADFSVGAGMSAADVREHQRRLQTARLLAHTGCYDIERQITTKIARELAPVWTSAYLTAQSLGLARPDEHVAVPIETVLRLAADPSLTAVRALSDQPATHRELTARLTAAGAVDLAARLPEGTPLLPGQGLSHTAANRALFHLRTLYIRLHAWHENYVRLGWGPESIARGRRTIAAAPTTSTPTLFPAQAPAIDSATRRAPRR